MTDNPRACMVALLISLLAVGWFDTFDEFSVSCTWQHGSVISHAGNQYCAGWVTILGVRMAR